MDIGNAIWCIADRGWFSLLEGQQVSPPRCFYFLVVLFSTAFFLTGVARAIRDRDATFSVVLFVQVFNI